MINRKNLESSRGPIMISCKVPDAWSFLHFTTIFNWRLKKEKCWLPKDFEWLKLNELRITGIRTTSHVLRRESLKEENTGGKRKELILCIYANSKGRNSSEMKTSPLADGEGLWSVAGRLWDKPQVHKLKSRVAYRNGRQVSLVPLVLSCSHPRWWVANAL